MARPAIAPAFRVFRVLTALAVLASPCPGRAAPAPASPSAPAPAEAPADDSPFAQAYREAFLAFKAKNYDAADANADKAAKLGPKSGRPAILKGRTAAARGDTAKAEMLIKAGIAMEPAAPAGYRALGDLYFRQRRFADARVAYLDARRCGDADPDVNLLLFYCAAGAGDLGEAERLFATFNAFDEKTPAYYFAKAALAHLKGREDDSRKALQDATVLYGSPVFSSYAADYFFLFAAKA